MWAVLFAGLSFGTSYAVAVGRLGQSWGSASLSDASVHRPLLGYLALTVLTRGWGPVLAGRLPSGLRRRVRADRPAVADRTGHHLAAASAHRLLGEHRGRPPAVHRGQQMINLPGGDGPGNNLGWPARWPAG